MDWFTPIDIYCERMSANFWAEPINALSNLSFIIAGLIFFIPLLLKRRKASGWLWILSILAIIVGIGSFLFHTFANRWSILADIIPIAIFMLAYFSFIFIHIFKWPYWLNLFGIIVFVFTCTILNKINISGLNHSQGYLPALAIFLGTAIYLTTKKSILKMYYWQAGGIFTLSLLFRTIDIQVCPTWPIGTHFLWHLLNGFLIYMLLKAVQDISKNSIY